MRYKYSDPRYDDPDKVMIHAGRFKNGVALVVLGGYSASCWESIRENVKPDVVIIANGANALVQGSDYWICAENMSFAHNKAQSGTPEEKAHNQPFVDMFHRESGAKFKLVSHRSIDRLKDKSNAIAIRRNGYEMDEIDEHFNLREYGLGLLAGWLMKRTEAGAGVHVGTVGAQCLHWAGILGCKEVHTIGYDLMFREDGKHHAYNYPLYKADRYRTDKFKTTYNGVCTQWAWLESAQWLKSVEYIFEAGGLRWRDHSGGLLSVMGLGCTQ